MHKQAITFAIAAAMLFAGSLAWKAEAETGHGATGISRSAQNFTPVQPAGCWGWGEHCRPGYTWVCRRGGRWCRLCR
jgi:hypothetical protein